MVYEEACNSCGRFRETKYCKIKKINVCYSCCVECEMRATCSIRVWFNTLKPISKSRVRGSILDNFY